MIRVKHIVAAVALWGLVAAAAPAAGHAQRPHIGPHGGYNFDSEDFLVGAQLSIPIAYNFELYPSFNYYFTDPGTQLGFNGDVKYRIPTASRLYVYLGGGVNLLHRSGGGLTSESDWGGNVLGGFETLLGRTHPFVEGRMLLHGNEAFQLLAGLNITLY